MFCNKLPYASNKPMEVGDRTTRELKELRVETEDIYLKRVVVYPCPVDKTSSVKCVVCHNFQRVSKSFKVCESIVRLSNIIYAGET